MTTQVPASINEEGTVVLNAKLFGDIVRRLPSESLEISVDEKNIAIIHSGASEFSIIGIPAEEFPEFPAVTDTVSFTISQPLLKSMIRQTLFAVSANKLMQRAKLPIVKAKVGPKSHDTDRRRADLR